MSVYRYDMRDEYMTADQVGDALSVNAARVRQLADERKIPRPISLGPRANLWQRSAIEVCRTRMSSSRARLTGQSALLEDATSPLQRTNDVLFPLNFRGSTSEVHARIWRGESTEGYRIAVVLSRPIDHPYSDAHIERIVEMIDDRYLSGRGSEAIWFEAYLSEFGGREPQFSLSNLVLSYGRHEVKSWNSGRYRAPVWIEQDVSEIDRISGTNVEWWPPAAYRTEEILRWQRDGGFLTSEIDRYDLEPLERAVAALRGIPSDAPWYEVAQKAIVYIAPDMAVRDQLYGLPWDDGTRPANQEGAPARFAARLTPRHLNDDLRELVMTISKGSAPEELDLSVLNNELWLWMKEVDEFSEQSNLELSAALRTVLEVMEQRGEGAMRSPMDPIPRVFEIAGQCDESFLASLTWVTGEDIDRGRRELHRELGESEQVEYATAFDEYLVARIPGEKVFAVMWPTHSDLALSEERSLVGDHSVGDRPVYVEEGGRIIGLLALGPHHFRDWNWGYPGGVDDLAGAIMHHALESHPGTKIPRDWIEDFLGYAVGPSMRIEMNDILRRSVPMH
jgi:predicted DNA-binding transcriptional regulator AlpA